MLSRCVPVYRCLGLQQRRLLHLCRISAPEFIGPRLCGKLPLRSRLRLDILATPSKALQSPREKTGKRELWELLLPAAATLDGEVSYAAAWNLATALAMSVELALAFSDSSR